MVLKYASSVSHCVTDGMAIKAGFKSRMCGYMWYAWLEEGLNVKVISLLPPWHLLLKSKWAGCHQHRGRVFIEAGHGSSLGRLGWMCPATHWQAVPSATLSACYHSSLLAKSGSPLQLLRLPQPWPFLRLLLWLPPSETEGEGETLWAVSLMECAR